MAKANVVYWVRQSKCIVHTETSSATVRMINDGESTIENREKMEADLGKIGEFLQALSFHGVDVTDVENAFPVPHYPNAFQLGCDHPRNMTPEQMDHNARLVAANFAPHRQEIKSIHLFWSEDDTVVLSARV